jgi:magnesium-protoporphyrin IX monomethyl ester (oxidative) cyclase
MRKVPLGLAYLAGALEARGISVEAYNLNVDDLEAVDLDGFDFIGVTLLTPFIDEVNQILEHVRRWNQTARLVVGGAHPTYQIEEVFNEVPLIDYAVVGEGEVCLPELVLNEAGCSSIAGVYFRTPDGEICGTPRKVADVNHLPYPSQRLFDHGQLEKRNPFRAILAARGCPYKCFNCQPILSTVQPFRLRTPVAVADEIEYLQKEYGQTYFGFLDSEFPIKKSWLIELHRLIRERRLEIAFHCNARADLLDIDILCIFRDLNITRLAIGVESGVPRVVNQVLHKNIDLERTREVFEEARTAGVRTHGHFMIGIPGETMEEMHQTLTYATELPAASIEFNMLTPWPGTAFYDICLRSGYLTETNTARFNEKRACYISTEEFTNQQVEAFYQEIRTALTTRGWINTPDGSVYFHPILSTAADLRNAS